mmetsp:Transcript_22905/g.77958  ORF Transcript_22905/g.77958 Transcript_22905/m.77958 type:complete len:508 (-) Transcript_22905:1217-2740(-)
MSCKSIATAVELLTDGATTSTNVPSCWRGAHEFNDLQQQTEVIPKAHVAVGSASTENIATQTAESVSNPPGGECEQKLSNENLSVTLETVLENVRSSTFGITSAPNEELTGNVDSTHVLQPFNEREFCLHGLVCTGISWNSSGRLLSASYGGLDISGWSERVGALCVWNLGKGEHSHMKPDFRIDVPSPLQCVAFHPSLSATVAGGTLSGNVIVWNLSQEGDAQRWCSQNSNISHREPVTQIVWLPHSDVKYGILSEPCFDLLSTSTDGQVLVWDTRSLGSDVRCYAVCSGDWTSPHQMLWGATCIGTSTTTSQDNKRDSFMVGTDCGKLFRCVIDKQRSQACVAAPGESIISFEYDSHRGSVQSISCSPFQRNLFASCGIDGTLKVFNKLSPSALLVLEPVSGYLTDCAWSPFRPLVLAALSCHGEIIIYDLTLDRLNPIHTISLGIEKEKQKGVQGMTLEFNPCLPEYLATTNGHSICTWELSPELCVPKPNENAALDMLSQLEG